MCIFTKKTLCVLLFYLINKDGNTINNTIFSPVLCLQVFLSAFNLNKLHH